MPAIVNLLFNVVSTNTTISFRKVLPMVSLVSLLVGFGGHLLLWLVLVRNPRTRSKPSSVLLLNLSLADLGALLTLPCVLLGASFQNWELGGATCVLLGFMTSVTVGVEIFSLAALSVLRYRIVAPGTRPPASLHRCRGTLAAVRRNKKATALLIASTLVFAISWLPYYALEFVNVMSPHVSSAASPINRLGRKISSTSAYLSSTLPKPTEETETRVSLLWEVTSLTAILLVCLAPCWNPPLYFLLSRPAVRQLRALLPSFLCRHLGKNPVQRWRIAPAPPPCLPPPQPPSPSLTHQTLTHGLTQ